MTYLEQLHAAHVQRQKRPGGLYWNPAAIARKSPGGGEGAAYTDLHSVVGQGQIDPARETGLPAPSVFPSVAAPIPPHPGDGTEGAALPHSAAPSPSVKSIIVLVCGRFQVSVSDLLGPCRIGRISFARHVAMYLARRFTKHSVLQLGRFFGGRDHTVLTYAAKKIAALRTNDSALDCELSVLEAALKGERGDGGL